MDDIDRCVLFMAELKCNKPNKYDEKNFHLAVWHEDLLELQAKSYVRGVQAGSHRKWEKESRKKLFAHGKLFYKDPDGNFREYIPDPISDYDCHNREWPIFRDDSITLTSSGRLAALELLRATSRRELRPLGMRVMAALDAGLFDTAVREACVTLETDLKRQLKVTEFGDRLVEEYAKHLRGFGVRESFVRTLRIELRAVFKFLRNDFMHNLRKLDEARSTAILLRVVKVRNSIKAVKNALHEHTSEKISKPISKRSAAS